MTHTLHETARTFTAALADADIGQAATAAVALDDREATPETRLDAIADAIENGDDPEAAVLLAALGQTYERRQAREGIETGRATATLDGRDLATSEQQALTDHLDAAARAQLQRGEVLTTASMFTLGANASGDGRASVAESVRQLAETERERTARARRGTGLVRRQTLPARVEPVAASLAPDRIAADGVATLRVVVANLGDEPAENSRVRASGNSEIEPSRRPVPALAGGEQATVSVSVSPPAPGEYDLTATVNEAGTKRTTLVVLADTPVVRALETEPDGRLSTDAIQRAVAYWYDDDPVPGTGGRRLAIDDLYWLVTAWARDLPVV